MPSLAAAAAVWRAWFDWVAPWVTTISAPSACASAIRYSSLRVLLPPVLRPVQSSRLIQMSGPPRWSLRRGMYSSGVGRCARRTRGNLARFMTISGICFFGKKPQLPLPYNFEMMMINYIKCNFWCDHATGMDRGYPGRARGRIVQRGGRPSAADPVGLYPTYPRDRGGARCTAFRSQPKAGHAVAACAQHGRRAARCRPAAARFASWSGRDAGAGCKPVVAGLSACAEHDGVAVAGQQSWPSWRDCHAGAFGHAQRMPADVVAARGGCRPDL